MRIRRKTLYFFIMILMVCLSFSGAMASQNIKILINGQQRAFYPAPIVDNGSTLVPMRTFFESLGAQVEWNGSTKTVVGQRGNIIVKLTINSRVALVNNNQVALSLPGKIINGNTYIPLRFVGEALGDQVVWNAASKTISITSEFAVSTPKANSKTYLRIPTPYDDGTEWAGRINQATHPSIVQFATVWHGYKYWMAFTPYPYSYPSKENPCIVASNDGINWVVPTGVTNPLVARPADGYNSDPHLFYNSTTSMLELWYRQCTTNKVEIIYRITSVNGTTWTSPETMLTSDLTGLLNYVSPSIIFENSKYRMWVNRNYELFLLESKDGKTWTDVGYVNSKNVVIRNCWHPNVIKIGSTYYLINCSKNTNLGTKGELKYATSTDGINWSEEQYILSYTGSKSDYDGAGVYRGSLIIEDNNLMLLYGQVSSDNKWTIGLTRGRSINTLIGLDDDTFR